MIAFRYLHSPKLPVSVHLNSGFSDIYGTFLFLLFLQKELETYRLSLMFSRDEYLPECSVGVFHTYPAEILSGFIPNELTSFWGFCLENIYLMTSLLEKSGHLLTP